MIAVIDDREALAVADEHLEDWCALARDVFGVTLDEEQQAVLRSVQHSKKTSVKSGTSRGKDFIAAVAAMCFMYTTPSWNEKGEMVGNTKVFMTAPTDRQVGDIMYPEISRLFNKARVRGFVLPGRLSGYGIRTDVKEWFLTGFKSDDNNVVAWTGLHAVNIMFIVTEASGIPQLVFDSIEGNLQGNSRILLVFNDNTGSGYAAETFNKPEWSNFRLDSLNATNVVEKKIIIPGQVDWDWVNGRVNAWCQRIEPEEFSEAEGDFYWEGIPYRPNDLFRVKVRGMGPKVASDVLVPIDWIRLANDNWRKAQQGHTLTSQGDPNYPQRMDMQTKALRLGVDVAGMGRDSSCFCHRYSRYVEKFEIIQSGGQMNHMEVAGRVYNLQKRKNAAGAIPQSFIDTIGEGAGVYSRLIELAKEKAEIKDTAVHSVKFSEAPEWNNKPLTDLTGEYEFLNMRAYLYWAVRDWLNPVNKTGACLPPDHELTDDLSKTIWKFMSNGKIQIESKEDIKKKLGRSPDKGDALANTFYPVPDIDINPKPQRNSWKNAVR